VGPSMMACATIGYDEERRRILKTYAVMVHDFRDNSNLAGGRAGFQ